MASVLEPREHPSPNSGLFFFDKSLRVTGSVKLERRYITSKYLLPFNS